MQSERAESVLSPGLVGVWLRCPQEQLHGLWVRVAEQAHLQPTMALEPQ